jgi:hypothetical protein
MPRTAWQWVYAPGNDVLWDLLLSSILHDDCSPPPGAVVAGECMAVHASVSMTSSVSVLAAIVAIRSTDSCIV